MHRGVGEASMRAAYERDAAPRTTGGRGDVAVASVRAMLAGRREAVPQPVTPIQGRRTTAEAAAASIRGMVGRMAAGVLRRLPGPSSASRVHRL